MPVSTECAAALLSFRYPSIMSWLCMYSTQPAFNEKLSILWFRKFTLQLDCVEVYFYLKIPVHLTVVWLGKSILYCTFVAERKKRKWRMWFSTCVPNMYQLSHWSSVTKCDAKKFTKCTKNQLDVRITGNTSADNTKWVCSAYSLKITSKTFSLW